MRDDVLLRQPPMRPETPEPLELSEPDFLVLPEPALPPEPLELSEPDLLVLPEPPERSALAWPAVATRALDRLQAQLLGLARRGSAREEEHDG